MSANFDRGRTPVRIAEEGLVGWRRTVGDRVAQAVAPRTNLSVDQVRALVGGLFFLLALRYVVGAVNRALRGAR